MEENQISKKIAQIAEALATVTGKDAEEIKSHLDKRMASVKMIDCDEDYAGQAKLIASRVTEHTLSGHGVIGQYIYLYRHPDGNYIFEMRHTGHKKSLKIVTEELAMRLLRDLTPVSDETAKESDNE